MAARNSRGHPKCEPLRSGRCLFDHNSLIVTTLFDYDGVDRGPIRPVAPESVVVRGFG
jgi:hypothetical protein